MSGLLFVDCNGGLMRKETRNGEIEVEYIGVEMC